MSAALCLFQVMVIISFLLFRGKSLEVFGGESGFKETLRRDSIKRNFLMTNEINLLEIHYQNESVEETILNFIFRSR